MCTSYPKGNHLYMKWQRDKNLKNKQAYMFQRWQGWQESQCANRIKQPLKSCCYTILYLFLEKIRINIDMCAPVNLWLQNLEDFQKRQRLSTFVNASFLMQVFDTMQLVSCQQCQFWNVCRLYFVLATFTMSSIRYYISAIRMDGMLFFFLLIMWFCISLQSEKSAIIPT